MSAEWRRVTRQEAKAPVTELPIGPREWPRRAQDWLCAGREDYELFRERRATTRHYLLRQRCKNIWILAGIAMMLNPAPSVLLVMTLLSSLLSFAILDETRESS